MTAPDTETADTKHAEKQPRAARRLWRALGVIVVLALLARVALPAVVAMVVENQASEILGVSVEVEDVGLELIGGEFAINGLRVGGVPIEGVPAPDDLLRAERVFVRIGIVRSLSGEPHVEEVRIVSPRIRLRRLLDGSLDAGRLARNESSEQAAPAASAPLAATLGTLRLTGLDFELEDEAQEGEMPVRVAVGELVIRDLSLDADRIRVGRIDLDPSEVDLGHLAPLGFALSIHASDLSTQPGHTFPLRIETALTRPKSTGLDPLLALEGRVAIEPAAFEGRIESRKLPLPALVGALGLGELGTWLRAGTASGALSVQLATNEDAARELRTSGRLRVEDLSIADDLAEEEREIGLAWKSLEIDLREALVQLAADGTLGAPPQIRLSGITVEEHDIRFTHGGEALAALGNDTRAPDTQAHARAEATPARPQLTLDYVKIAGGRFQFIDHSTDPSFHDHIEALELEAARIDPDTQTVDKLDLRFETGDAVLSAKGGVGDQKELAIAIEGLDLSPFNAYVMSRAGYVIDKGVLTLHARIAQDGELISATNAITLQDLDVSEVGDGGFRDQFGMSLPMALALLRDHERKISLDVPIERKGDETDLGLGRLTVDALRTALVGALTSPLKLVFPAVPGGYDDAAQPRSAF
ncbi:MAG: DUF748 domain-containing protein [bacterium]|nr:DUF748 domain-containing protein [bacterium]